MTAQNVLDVLAALVSFDTTSSRSNRDLIDWVTQTIGGRASRIERFDDASGAKASLWITFGPLDRPGYVLSGHSDVVPVAGQAWRTDPFRLSVAEGRAYGRGAVDMKGFLAACIARAADFAAANLTCPIHLAISYDEEIGCVGVRPMLEAIAARSPRPLGCFVGEPTGMTPMIGHKGKVAYRMIVTGEAGHTSQAPRFVNALDYGARIASAVAGMGDELQRTGRRDALYDVPHTTVIATGMRAGTARNIVPDRCEVDWECRFIERDDRLRVEDLILTKLVAQLRGEIAERSAKASVEIEKTIDYPGLAIDRAHPMVELAQRLSASNGTVSKVAFGTEAGLFQAIADIPTVVMGPGSIDVAHQPDEFIEITQLNACEAFLRRLIEVCSG